MSAIEIVGWLGGTMLAICALPQTIKTVRTRKAHDISWAFLLLWGGGEILMLIYAIIVLDSNLILLYNYICNAVMIGIIAAVKRGNHG